MLYLANNYIRSMPYLDSSCVNIPCSNCCASCDVRSAKLCSLSRSSSVRTSSWNYKLLFVTSRKDMVYPT